MADHLWFIPVSGGGPLVQVPAESLNVQWEFDRYPSTADVATVNMALSLANWTMPAGVGSACLKNCHGSWGWKSHACPDPGNIIIGGQLAVGTVFAHELPFPPGIPPIVTWSDVDVWVKFRVNDVTKLSAIFLSINDDNPDCLNTATSADILPAVTDNEWKVAFLTNNTWTNWNNENLRAVITFQGMISGVPGAVQIDIEWFAFRLRDV